MLAIMSSLNTAILSLPLSLSPILPPPHPHPPFSLSLLSLSPPPLPSVPSSNPCSLPFPYFAISLSPTPSISLSLCYSAHLQPRGGVPPFQETSACITQLTVGPSVVHVWSRNGTLELNRVVSVSPEAGRRARNLLSLSRLSRTSGVPRILLSGTPNP